MNYKHTQTGWTLIYALGSALVVMVVLSQYAADPTVWPLIAVLALALFLFRSLTVSVGRDIIELAFGPGLIRKRIRTSEVKTVKTVRQTWWCGFGIHGFPGRGWLFNVSGLDAVELVMKNGMVYRIGTDEPQKLSEAIQGYLSP